MIKNLNNKKLKKRTNELHTIQRPNNKKTYVFRGCTYDHWIGNQILTNFYVSKTSETKVIIKNLKYELHQSGIGTLLISIVKQYSPYK